MKKKNNEIVFRKNIIHYNVCDTCLHVNLLKNEFGSKNKVHNAIQHSNSLELLLKWN